MKSSHLSTDCREMESRHHYFYNRDTVEVTIACTDIFCNMHNNGVTDKLYLGATFVLKGFVLKIFY